MKRYLFLSTAAVMLWLTTSTDAEEKLSLAGEWRLALGAPEPTFPQATLPSLALTETIELPGTTELRGKGPLNPGHDDGGLTRIRKFEGAAWYQREVEIPAAWKGQHVELTIERTRHAQVWFDDLIVGEQGRLTATQRYDLTKLVTPGRHRITVMVDNRAARRPVPGSAHQFGDSAQTNWNGLLGQLELVASPRMWIEDVQIYPQLDRRSFIVKAALGSLSGEALSGEISVDAESFNHPGAPQRVTTVKANLVNPVTEIELSLGNEAKLWDEFSPALYRVKVVLETSAGRDERVVQTGLREFRGREHKFTINGRPTFLRGKHEAGVFPNEGFPPMDVAGWRRYLTIVKAWGFNHVRCHTWVPPEAAFAAADELGIYLQPELPYWGSFDQAVNAFLTPEAEATLRAYGNHPSFVMLTLGNELGGDRSLMNALVQHLRASDGRHLYADGSNNYFWDAQFQPTNDFMISAKAKPPANPSRTFVTRGSFCALDGNEGHTQWGNSDTRYDLAAGLAGMPVPFIGHETGQWTVYPDFADVPKYTGVVRPYNLERFRDSLARHGLLEQLTDFHRASGALAAELYHEENELFLRTAEMAGFQHLDLQDYPGQGSALVGLLDAFMENKGLVSAEEFRRSCSAIVPLARFDKYTWRTSESYVADLQLAHYGPADLRDVVTTWKLVDASGSTIGSGEIRTGTIAQGGLRNLGRVEIPLHKVRAPVRCNLEVQVSPAADGTGPVWSQHWPVWVYPSAVDTQVPAGVSLVRTFAAAQRLLEEGGRVLLIPEAGPWANTLPGAYATDYWNWPMFNNTPGTMGLLIQEKHRALGEFPTSFRSERQWAPIALASTPVFLLNTPHDFRPIVQVIDNYERNEKLGLVFETRVGHGRLLVCAVNLLAENLRARPEAQQLLASLLHYAASDAFAPSTQLRETELRLMLRPSLAQQPGVIASASSSFKSPWGFVPKPEHAIDGDANTRWFAAEEDKAPWVAVDFGDRRSFDTVELVWESDQSGYGAKIETSVDGQTWTESGLTLESVSTAGRSIFGGKAETTRHVRVRLSEWPKDRRPTVRELRVLGS